MPSRLRQNSAPFFFVLWRLNISSVQHFPFELQHKIGEEDNTELFFFLKMNIKVKTERRSDETRVGQKIGGVCAGSALLWRPKGRPSLVKSLAVVQGKNMDQTVIVWINTFPNWFQILAVIAVTWSVFIGIYYSKVHWQKYDFQISHAKQDKDTAVCLWDVPDMFIFSYFERYSK